MKKHFKWFYKGFSDPQFWATNFLIVAILLSSFLIILEPLDDIYDKACTWDLIHQNLTREKYLECGPSYEKKIEDNLWRFLLTTGLFTLSGILFNLKKR